MGANEAVDVEFAAVTAFAAVTMATTESVECFDETVVETTVQAK